MFYKLAWRNSKRSRNENLIYFFTMVIAVAAFYMLLYRHIQYPCKGNALFFGRHSFFRRNRK